MKVIENKNENPYTNLSLISKKPTVFEGRSYNLLTYVKEYSFAERLNRFTRIIFPTIFTLGIILVKEFYARKWEIVLHGQREKEILIPRIPIKVLECPLLGSNDSNRDIELIQSQLDERQIPVNCRKSFPLINQIECTLIPLILF